MFSIAHEIGIGRTLAIAGKDIWRRMILKRIIFKFLRIILLLALYCWIGKAIYLFFFSPGFYPGFEGLARAHFAIRDSLLTLPGMLMMIFSFLAGLIQSVHATLVSQLGYDPFDIFDILPNPWSGGGQAGPPAKRPNEVINFAILMAVGLSIAQFVLLFLLGAFRFKIGWHHGIPFLHNIGIKLLYFATIIGIAFWLAQPAFEAGFTPGVVSVLVAALLIRFPLISGLPLFLLVVFGLQPTFPPLLKHLSGLKARLFQTTRRRQGGIRPDTGGRETKSRRQLT